ncbi:MAG TPA: antitoxin [Thermoanaerobaculia bacterium]|nr:antitoxin [Thermoanaerobaculia bacterium]
MKSKLHNRQVREAKKIATASDLRKFFAACRRRETEREPEWNAHLRMMDASRGRGRSGT